MTENYHVIRDTVAPTISMSDVIIKDTEAASYNLMTGVSVADNSGVTPTVTTSGSLSSTPGTYTITYTVRDAAGNIQKGTRSVSVKGQNLAQATSDLSWCSYRGADFLKNVWNENINYVLGTAKLELYARKDGIYYFLPEKTFVEYISPDCTNSFGKYTSILDDTKVLSLLSETNLYKDLEPNSRKFLAYKDNKLWDSQDSNNTCGERQGNGFIGADQNQRGVQPKMQELNSGTYASSCYYNVTILYTDNVGKGTSMGDRNLSIWPWLEIPEDAVEVVSGTGYRNNPYVIKVQ